MFISLQVISFEGDTPAGAVGVCCPQSPSQRGWQINTGVGGILPAEVEGGFAGWGGMLIPRMLAQHKNGLHRSTVATLHVSFSVHSHESRPAHGAFNIAQLGAVGAFTKALVQQ